MLHIHNSLTKVKEPFVPITPGKVRLYVCGMTVYDYCHLGHARVLVVFDTVVRHLRSLGYDVTYVRNITDIDDKIIRRANENGEEIGALTSRFIQAMNEDADKLGVVRPDAEPRATQHIGDIVALIETLIKKGYAYAAHGRASVAGGGTLGVTAAHNGNVYYAVSRFKGYGKLSGKHLDDLRAGERVEIDEAKHDPLDFVLWKSAKPDEPSWESPWGQGRPGWHIECSAMSMHCLGDHFDIHGGGMDLMFPHHENEIAQSEGASGQTFVNVWMHNGFVRVDDEKMSKSLGNFFTVHEVLKQYQPEEIRYFILSSHYRGSLNYSHENLYNARAALTRFYTALRGLPIVDGCDGDEYALRFNAAMDDDFNTPVALAVLFDLARDINKLRTHDATEAARLAGDLRRLGAVLGLVQGDADSYLQRVIGSYGTVSGSLLPLTINATGSSIEAIQALIEQRNAARENKNWAESDRIRDFLKSDNILLEDGPTGTTWRRE